MSNQRDTTSDDSLIDKVISIVKDTPNNMELGEKIRRLFNG